MHTYHKHKTTENKHVIYVVTYTAQIHHELKGYDSGAL
jgi:hypothetical protein